MEGTKILSALLPVAIALAAEVGNANAQDAANEEFRDGFSTHPDWVRINVENPNWTKIRIYVGVRGAYVLIGTARRLNSTTFYVPRNLVGRQSSVMLLAHPISESLNRVATRLLLGSDGSATWEITGLPSHRLRQTRS